MTGLLFDIQNAGNQYENVTSDVLAEILNGIPACKGAFLNLFDQSIPKSTSRIEREIEVGSDEAKGRVDFGYWSNDCVVVIENKPWEPESSINGQLSFYAKVMQSWSEQRKYLCLLSTETNRERLLNEIAQAENVSVPTLAAAFLQKNIIFIERTWEQVFSTLKTVQPENEALRLWIKTLQDYFPKEIVLTGADQQEYDSITDSWDEKIVPIVQNLIRQMSDKSKFYGYETGSLSYPSGRYKGDFYGNYFADPHTDMVYWIGAYKSIWKKYRPEKHRLFIIQTNEYCFNLYKKRIPIALDELRKVQFEPVEEHKSYVFPLVDLAAISTRQVEEMAEKAMKAMNAVRDAIAFGVK